MGFTASDSGQCSLFYKTAGRAERHRLRWRARVKPCFMPPVPRHRAQKRLAKPDRRRALELFAGCGPQGCTEATMLAHGFTVPLMVELVRTGLATAQAERVRAGNKTIEVAQVRITDAGRRVLDNK